jgi:hypothetical protein
MWTSLLASIALLLGSVFAIGQQSSINFEGDGIELVSSSSVVQIRCDKDDWPAVLRVCDDIAMDFGRVTGINGSVTLLSSGAASMLNASMIYNITGKSTFSMPSSATAGGTIIAGTIGNSSIIDQLSKEGKIDVSAIEGMWEAYVTAVVDSPMDDVEQALVIAGRSSHRYTGRQIVLMQCRVRPQRHNIWHV